MKIILFNTLYFTKNKKDLHLLSLFLEAHGYIALFNKLPFWFIAKIIK